MNTAITTSPVTYSTHRRPDRARRGPAHARPARSAATYRRRRAVLAVAIGLVVAPFVGALDGVTGRAEATVEPPAPMATTIAQPGDTLWNLAAEHRGDESHADYLDRLVAVNGGASISAGQVLLLP